jgi:hypothetical protein
MTAEHQLQKIKLAISCMYTKAKAASDEELKKLVEKAYGKVDISIQLLVLLTE